MKTKYDIKNFRVFDEVGASVELEPLTILTGCNSSGKSSIVKSLILLDSFLKRVKNDYTEGNAVNLRAYRLDFTQYPNNLLGKFSSIVNNESENNEVLFAYTNYSRMLGEEVKVEMIFSPDENDILDNGYLKSLKLYMGEDVIYSSNATDGTWININLILDRFTEFVQIQALANNILGLESEYEFSNLSKDEYEKQSEIHKAEIMRFPKERKRDVFSYLRFRYGKTKNIISLETLKDGILEPLMENGSLFYIPLIKDLSTKTKPEQIGMLLSYIQKEDNIDKKNIYNRMVNDFEKSEFYSIDKYFHSIENTWREKINLKSIYAILDRHKGPRVAKKDDIKIPQNHLIHSPRNSFICNFDKEDKVVRDIEKEIHDWINVELSFPIVYEIVMHINSLVYGDDDMSMHYTVHNERYDFMEGYSHKILSYLSMFMADLMEEVLCPDWVGKIGYVSSSRVDIRRMYNFQSDSDFSRLLRNYFEYGRIYRNYLKNYNCTDKRSYEPDSFMNQWVKKFGIGEKIQIVADEDTVGVKIFLYKTNDKSSLLANEGYGITQLMSILLQIECAIQSAEKVKVNDHLNQHKLDGYNTDEFHYAEQTIFIEEPEIHLHPRYQSFLADMFAEAVKAYNIHFIIETHSEYLIRRLQVLTKNDGLNDDAQSNAISRNNVSIYYIENEPYPHARRIGICKNGYLDDDFGTGFFDEATNLARKLR